VQPRAESPPEPGEGLPCKPATSAPAATLAAALLGFFVITLDAVVVNVALPAMGRELSAGLTGLQWVVDGYTLMFAALLLSAGAITDRIGARRAFAWGTVAFAGASIACAAAPDLRVLVAARLVQGVAAALMMPSSMALIGQAYPDPVRRGRAVGLWAMGGAVAASSGPVLGGLLTLLSWRWIFLVNLPVGLVALLLLRRTERSPQRAASFDAPGQCTAVLAMGAVTFGAIEAGALGLRHPVVLGALAVALLASAAFVAVQRRVAHPMIPPGLLAQRNARIATAVGFAFMAGYFGLPFVMSLYLQQHRGLSALETGLHFLPMMLVGLLLTPFSARLAERLGPRALVASGLACMTAGLLALGLLAPDMSNAAISALMLLVGLAGPLVSPPITAVLLNSVPHALAGTASGVYNTSRQLGGALAIAVFGALLNTSDSFESGLRSSLVLAAVVALTAGLFSMSLTSTRRAPT